MPIIVTAKEEILVGSELVIDGPSPEGRFVTVFEDDGETGYFYALDVREDGNAIVDALHIYDVAKVSDRTSASVAAIGWSKDGEKSVLLINDFAHAVFDFSTCQGRCRTGFPPSRHDSIWSSDSRQWDDSVVELFK